MKLATVLSGQAFILRSLKEVLAKANELKSGDVLAGVAASSDLERIAAKEVLSQLLLSGFCAIIRLFPMKRTK